MGAVSGRVLQVEALGLVEVVLDGGHLPGSADGVLDLNGDLGAVEGRAAGVRDDLEPGGVAGVLKGPGGGGPVRVGADELVLLGSVLVAGGQLEVESVSPRP